MREAGNVCIGCVISDFRIFFLFLSAFNQRSEVTGMVPLFSLFSFSFSLVQNMMRAVSNPIPSQSMPGIVIGIVLVPLLLLPQQRLTIWYKVSC